MEQVLALVNLKDYTPTPGLTDWGTLVSSVVRNAFVLAGVIAFVLLIFGGFGVVLGAGSGDSKRLEQSKQTLTAAVLGLLIVIGSFFIVQVIETLTGIKLLKPDY